MIAAMYLRKSRAEENESMEMTLARHKDSLEQFAASNDLVVTEVYEEVASGDSLFARPAMLKLLDEIERYEALLCMDLDRLGRGNMKEQGIILEAIKEAGVKIITPRKIYDLNNELDETYSEFQAFMARQELKLIKSRMQRGLRKSAEEGSHMSLAPYGYRKTKVSKKSTLEIIPEETEVVRRIFQQYADGAGSLLIATQLNEMGITSQKGKPWTQVTIKRILRNQAYIGRIVYGRYNYNKRIKNPVDRWIISDGLHEAIIDGELFERVQAITKERYIPPMYDYNSVSNPFAGLIKCARCGYAVCLRSHNGYTYLACKTKQCNCASGLDALESALLVELHKHVDHLEALQTDVTKEDQKQSLLPALEMELDKLTKQKNRLHDLLEQGVYSIVIFNERKRAILTRIRQLEDAIAQEKKNASVIPVKTDIMIPRIKDVISTYKDGTPHEKNVLLKTVLKRIVYFRAKGSKSAPITLWLEFR